MNLAEIAQAFDRFEAQVLDADGEISPELAREHEALQLQERQKVDGLAMYVRSLEQQALGLKAIEEELAEKRARVERRVKWLKAYAQQYLEARGLKEVRGDVYRLCLQRNGGAPPVELLKPAVELPDWACRVVRVPDLDALRERLLRADAEALGVAVLKVPGLHLRIR